MPNHLPAGNETPATPADESFLNHVCAPFLLHSQNPDGGWAFHPESPSCVEPASWALLALNSLAEFPQAHRAVQRGCDWLRAAQLPNGSWPSQPGLTEGSWVTAPACFALQLHPDPGDAVARGIDWLCHQRPSEGRLWWRFLHWVQRSSAVVRHDLSLPGWSWTPGTSSWVEPTAVSLILLRGAAKNAGPSTLSRRCRQATALLYDRMCPGGGWNSGNPIVYGVPGEPQPASTAWALLALQEHHDRKENQESLRWLARIYPRIEGPSSLALSRICLRTCGHTLPPGPDFHRLHARNEFFRDVSVYAWVTLALVPLQPWLSWSALDRGQP